MFSCSAARQVSLSFTISRSCSNSCPLSQWCHPAILSSVLLFLTSILPSIKIFSSESDLHIRWPKYRSFSSSISPSLNIQDLCLLGLTGWISLQSRGFSRVFSNTTVQKHHFFSAQPSLRSSSHIHTWLLEKTKLWRFVSLSARWCLCFLICYLGLSQLFSSACEITQPIKTNHTAFQDYSYPLWQPTL